MKHNLLVVIKPGPTATRGADYVANACTGDPEEKRLRHPTGFTVWLVE